MWEPIHFGSLNPLWASFRKTVCLHHPYELYYFLTGFPNSTSCTASAPMVFDASIGVEIQFDYGEPLSESIHKVGTLWGPRCREIGGFPAEAHCFSLPGLASLQCLILGAWTRRKSCMDLQYEICSPDRTVYPQTDPMGPGRWDEIDGVHSGAKFNQFLTTITARGCGSLCLTTRYMLGNLVLAILPFVHHRSSRKRLQRFKFVMVQSLALLCAFFSFWRPCHS